MKILYKGMSVLLLTAVLILTLAACRGNGPDGKTNGLYIEEDTSYSAETLEYAEQTIFSLLTDIYREAVMDSISEKAERRLADYAHRICNITAAKPIAEEQYRLIIGQLAEKGSAAAEELICLREGISTECETARELYLDFSAVFGADRAASMLYDGCLLIYDVRYERTIEKLETYQYPWYQEEADALAAEKSVFIGSIGKESFSVLVRCFTAMSELMSLEPGEMSDAFSDTEWLQIIRHLDLSEINIDAEGWMLLLSHAPSFDASPYHSGLLETFKESGDAARVAEKMNDVLRLSVSIMNRLTPEDIALLRAGKGEELTLSVFSRFDGNDWDLFASVSSVSLANGEYSALAAEEYGDAYSEYLTNIRPMDMDTLRSSVNDPHFSLYLSDYIAAICPALFYEVRV